MVHTFVWVALEVKDDGPKAQTSVLCSVTFAPVSGQGESLHRPVPNWYQHTFPF